MNFKSIIISIMILGIFLLLLLNGCSLFRQYGSIEGYVYVPDTVNKGAIIIRDSNQVPTGYKPLPGAKVSVQDFYNFVFTDINGYFLLEDVITGLVNLIIEPPINSGYNSLTTQVMVEPDTTVPVGTYGAVSLPSEGADYWDIVINQIDDSEYPEVKVYVSVIDPGNDIPIVGATSDNFELDINGNKINTFTVTQAPGEISYPASVSLVIDRSGSMEGEYGDDQPLEDAKAAAKTFVNLMGSSDRAEVISFADYVTVDQSFTSNKQALYDAIDSLNSDGGTALYDAIWKGLDDAAEETNPRKAVIALTDGGENSSSYDHGGGDPPDNSELIRHAVQEVKIPIYTIGLAGFDFTREKIARNYSTTEVDLKEIGKTTGGDYFYAPSSDKLEKIYKEITQRLEQQYIITFTDNTGITEGYLTVKLYYNQLYGEDTKEYNPPAQEYENKTEYRALLVGVGDYINSPDWYPYAEEATDLLSPPYNVKMVKKTLKQCRFGSLNTEFISIENVMDTWATKLAILYGIKSSFAGADANDISYFYFNGHGTRDFDTSYLCPTSASLDVFLWLWLVTDTSSCISVDELESALSAVPGTKVVLLDCCRSGGFIGKGEDEVTSDDSVDFNNDVINVFSQSSSNKGNLATNKYIVLTTCASNQISYEHINVDIMDDEYILTEDPYCYFTKFLCEGCGYNQVCPYPADSNIDTQVTLNEAYTYIKDQSSTVSTLNETDVQIWPENSSFTIVEY